MALPESYGRQLQAAAAAAQPACHLRAPQPVRSARCPRSHCLQRCRPPRVDGALGCRLPRPHPAPALRPHGGRPGQSMAHALCSSCCAHRTSASHRSPAMQSATLLCRCMRACLLSPNLLGAAAAAHREQRCPPATNRCRRAAAAGWRSTAACPGTMPCCASMRQTAPCRRPASCRCAALKRSGVPMRLQRRSLVRAPHGCVLQAAPCKPDEWQLMLMLLCCRTTWLACPAGEETHLHLLAGQVARVQGRPGAAAAAGKGAAARPCARCWAPWGWPALRGPSQDSRVLSSASSAPLSPDPCAAAGDDPAIRAAGRAALFQAAAG